MQIPLLQGAYKARSVIANAQRCVNLYPEKNPPGAISPLTHYPTPGLTLLATPTVSAQARGLYQATNGKLYYVVGNRVYYVSPTWSLTQIGTVAGLRGQVAMVDNGAQLIIVDGTQNGWTVDLASGAFSTIHSSAFFGGDRVDYLDTFTILNLPGTKDFYCSLSNVLDFDPLYIASKTAFPDKIVALIVVHREIWLIGERTTEIWYDAGAPSFPFALVNGAFIECGCVAKYSVARQGDRVLWLSRDKDGYAQVMLGQRYEARAVSTMAVAAELSTYGDLSDAIGMTYQQQGHQFYMLTFPTADKTWVYDMTEDFWHERAWLDSDGLEHRHRANCMTFAYGTNVCGDWETGKLYKLDIDAYTDNGQPIVRRRGFPHLMNDGKLVTYNSFIADMETGTQPGTSWQDYQTRPFSSGFSSGFGPYINVYPPRVYLRWSNNRGQSFGNPVGQLMGAGGQYSIQPIWNRLGMARDRVFELFWSTPTKTALNGAFVTPEPLGN